MRKAVLWLGGLAADLSPRRIGFDRTSVDVGFAVNKAELAQVYP